MTVTNVNCEKEGSGGDHGTNTERYEADRQSKNKSKGGSLSRLSMCPTSSSYSSVGYSTTAEV